MLAHVNTGHMPMIWTLDYYLRKAMQCYVDVAVAVAEGKLLWAHSHPGILIVYLLFTSHGTIAYIIFFNSFLQ